MARPRGDIRTRVLHAARGRFLCDGVDGASLRRIAADAKTSIGMVYYYFPTKDDLFLGIVEEVYEVLLVDLTKALDPSRSVEDRIRGLYARALALSEDERLIVRLVLREALVSSSRLDSIVARFQRGHVPLLLQLMRDGMATGTFDPSIHPVSVVISMMVLGGPGQLLHRALGPKVPIPGVPTGAALAEQSFRILLRGVGKKGEGGGEAAP